MIEMDTILEWYGKLSPRAKRGLAIKDLHDLSKALLAAAPAEVEEIRKRHNELCIMYGGEPWDESCVEDGEQAHMDRGKLLAHVSARPGITAIRASARNDALDEAAQRIELFTGDGKFTDEGDTALCRYLAECIRALKSEEAGRRAEVSSPGGWP